jgi:hypothetical protein
MDELEHKLRSALTEMADEVAPSHHPWAAHQRRISARKSRKPFLMAAVAAAVVALIAVPVVVLQMRTDTVQAADIPESSPPPTAGNPRSPTTVAPPEGIYQPQAGETVLTQPVAVLHEGSGGAYVRTLAYTTERDGKRYLCLVQAKGQATVVINGPAASSCSVMNWPRAGKYVWASRFVSSSNQSSQMLYVAAEPTDNILVRRTDGPYASSYRIAQATDFALFAVFLGSNSPPAAYTARDKANVTLENG